ncbi:hypothetical protein GCM10009559_42860 [Pseudonocardia zijingensis]|uniref:Uncharacterized protein n=1 Tax=Pseudonocardia zijingensis TaxID=153376 RepID=A0ABN1QN60_9PSEU
MPVERTSPMPWHPAVAQSTSSPARTVVSLFPLLPTSTQESTPQPVVAEHAVRALDVPCAALRRSSRAAESVRPVLSLAQRPLPIAHADSVRLAVAVTRWVHPLVSPEQAAVETSLPRCARDEQPSRSQPAPAFDPPSFAVTRKPFVNPLMPIQDCSAVSPSADRAAAPHATNAPPAAHPAVAPSSSRSVGTSRSRSVASRRSAVSSATSARNDRYCEAWVR